MELKIIQGNFIENETVIVSIDGKEVSRKVHYSKEAGDLFIWYKNNKYFYYEFQ